MVIALGEFRVSVEGQFRVKRGIQSSEVSGAITSRAVESLERKFTLKHLVGGVLYSDRTW